MYENNYGMVQSEADFFVKDFGTGKIYYYEYH